MRFVPLSPKHVHQHINAYLRVHSDVSPWRAEQLLTDLPGKWELSFSAWEASPVAYCIMSRAHGPPHIHQLMVLQEKRGSGIGAVMLAEAVRRGATTLKIACTNAGAIRFYERHGWAVGQAEGDYFWMYHSAET